MSYTKPVHICADSAADGGVAVPAAVNDWPLPGPAAETSRNWKLLIIDDDEHVHAAIRVMLECCRFDERPIDIVDAYSETEAKQVLTETTDIAIVIVDVVMESDTSGFDLVEFIRNTRGNRVTRILLTTGQPGAPPESTLLSQYDINGYLEKIDITSQRFTNTVVTLLRSYRDINTISELLASLRLMNQDLQHKAQLLEDQQAQLEAEITLRKQAQLQLESLNRNLEEQVNQRTASYMQVVAEARSANAAKTEFLSRMSHELRTPLNSILGFAQLLRMDEVDLPTDRQLASIGEIEVAGRHLFSLINDILDFTKIEAGKVDINNITLSWSAVTDDCLRLAAPLAQEKHQQLGLRVVGVPSKYVCADARATKQILVNLISNAVKYSPAASRITLEVEQVDEAVVFRVIDQGPGIPADKLDKLFKPFDRLGAERTAVDGVGIGLSISRQLAKLMHSDITVENLVAGCVFGLPLPAAEVSTP
ncbi:response regulator [Exilibacterium tricleocarpae]|uniref:histidine kinase n=1 Tax=Exilibacterium tricleocarpae TaxID=2591008 RepID=A0A545SP00_9GAMM|nr:hybrid sensor histidine kinase/response regulator [Exilibacterium tricleocarpae]TQV66705.1 response regulator [Exilibacterium tricleocarpae]